MNQKNNQSTLLDVSVQRINSHSAELSWKPEDSKPTVFLCTGSRRKDALQKVPLDGTKNGHLTISGLDPSVRYYYHLVDEGGNRQVISERRVFLEGAVNFRDIGGYKTFDGREVKWGKVFRADGLARLTAGDHQLLRQIGIKHVFDFRTLSEANESPDRLPEDGTMTYVNFPVTHGKFDFVDAMKRLKKGDSSWMTPDFMVNGYIQNIEDFADVWGEVINCLDDVKSPPIVFHCTGGKDRTGTCAALILLMLGVPEKTVIEDHQLSNIYIADLLPKILKLIASYGIDPDVILPYLTAPKECIIAVLDHIRNKYGSASSYLMAKAGVTKEVQEILQEKLLV
ncbi:MAG: tyrosine-protein phosphatase [Dissulfuribacterales bacterium]